jgi:hypothetical protein
LTLCSTLWPPVVKWPCINACLSANYLCIIFCLAHLWLFDFICFDYLLRSLSIVWELLEYLLTLFMNTLHVLAVSNASWSQFTGQLGALLNLWYLDLEFTVWNKQSDILHLLKQAWGRSCMILFKLFWLVLPDSKSASRRSAWWATGLILIFSLGRMVAAKLCLSSLVLYNWFSFYYCTSSEYYHFSIVLLYMDWDKELVSLSYKFSQVFLVLCRSNNSGDTPKPWQLHPAWCLHKPDIWSSFCQESCQCLNSNRSNRMFGAY